VWGIRDRLRPGSVMHRVVSYASCSVTVVC